MHVSVQLIQLASAANAHSPIVSLIYYVRVQNFVVERSWSWNGTRHSQ